MGSKHKRDGFFDDTPLTGAQDGGPTQTGQRQRRQPSEARGKVMPKRIKITAGLDATMRDSPYE